MRLAVAVTMALSAALAAGCAIDRNPELQLAAAEVAIADARGTVAPGELKQAQEKMALGKRLVADRDYRPALWLAEQAHVDAELATMKAMSARALERATLASRELRAANILVARRAN